MICDAVIHTNRSAGSGEKSSCRRRSQRYAGRRPQTHINDRPTLALGDAPLRHVETLLRRQTRHHGCPRQGRQEAAEGGMKCVHVSRAQHVSAVLPCLKRNYRRNGPNPAEGVRERAMASSAARNQVGAY
jgi:hypothetical protein